MSRIGKKPVIVPKNVKVEIKDNFINVEGPKGKLKQGLKPKISFIKEEGQIIVQRADENKETIAMHGLYRNLLNNMVLGVTDGFSKVLTIIGVGYKAEVKGKELLLNIGYANQIKYKIPDGISITVEANTKITVSGADKQSLGQVCANIRAFRPPEPYKGKGIRYENEVVKKKVGKTGAK
ncbi:MAG: 50S ribosomal protein L6 [Spirochaetales bacterium]|nr:50S ribosomal protein L6 [Spirochaetales bacterium]